MYVTAAESRVLSRIFGLLSEDLSEHDVREAVGLHLLELLQADYYASFVWQERRPFRQGGVPQHGPEESRGL
jgi:hypothetical protein